MWGAFKALSLASKLFVLGLILAVLASVAALGYQKGSHRADLEIVKYEQKLANLTAEQAKEQAKVDVRVVTEYVDRVNTVERIVYKNRDVIVNSVPEQFVLTRGWVYAYNASLAGIEIDPVLAADETPTSITEMQALANNLAPNNAVCRANILHVEALQKWIKETYEVHSTK